MSGLALSALTAFTFLLTLGGRADLLSLALHPHLQHVLVLLGSGTQCLISISSLPAVITERPLIIRYNIQPDTRAAVLFHTDLLPDSSLQAGLHLAKTAEPWSQEIRLC